NTHLTGEALGLFYIGIAFPEFRSAERWKQKGLGILIEEMPRQIRGDGVYFEESSYYHRYAVDFYLSLFQTARENDIALPPEVEARLAAMINYLVWITRPDGTPTLVGDDDGGRLLTLGARSAYDFRDSIAWATALFGRSCWKHSADQKNPELLWLLGPSGIEQFDRLPTKTPDKHSRAFEATGQFVMRSGWEPRSEYFFFRCGPRGRLSGAHDHADQLSFELFADGTAWLVDPGTYTYTLGEAARNLFRLSESHNTLTADGASNSVPSGPFSWRSRAKGTSDKMISNHRFSYVG